jgi:arsenate reductase
VITVCSKDASERCPIFPGVGPIQPLHWPFDDPSQVAGIRKEKPNKFRATRDQIKQKILESVQERSTG